MEMDVVKFGIFSLLELFALIFGIFFIVYGSNSKKEQKEKRLLPLVIVGWTLTTLSIIAFVLCFVLYVNTSGGMTGTVLLMLLSPLFILGGGLGCVGIGTGQLVKAYRLEDKDVTRKQSIVRGWFLLSLAFVLVVLVIVTFIVLLNTYEGNLFNPVRFM